MTFFISLPNRDGAKAQKERRRVVRAIETGEDGMLHAIQNLTKSQLRGAVANSAGNLVLAMIDHARKRGAIVSEIAKSVLNATPSEAFKGRATRDAASYLRANANMKMALSRPQASLPHIHLPSRARAMRA